MKISHTPEIATFTDHRFNKLMITKFKRHSTIMYYLSRRNGERICQSSNIREYIVLVIIPAYTLNDALYVSHHQITHIIA